MKIEDLIKKYPNVVGVSKTLKPRIRKGKIVEEEKCIRIYVSKKLPIHLLKPKEIILQSINGIATDIVEIGELKALQDKKGKFRPVVFGISIGHIDISAGTNGWMFKDKKGNLYFGSNAHIFTPKASLDPEQIRDKRIVQPGPYDGGTELDIVAEYVWHRRLVPWRGESSCIVAKAWAGIYNFFSKVFGAKTRLKPVVEEYNRIDFAVAKPIVSYELRFPDMCLNENFVGLGFGGSNIVSCICKAKYIAEEGYTPLDVKTAEVNFNDKVEKTGRTSCHTRATVIDESAMVKIEYSGFEAVFDDVILTTKLMEPGDSGSSVWKIE